MSNYEDHEDRKFDSAFKAKAAIFVILGVGSVVALILGFHILTGTIK